MTSTGTHPPISTTPFTVNGITYTPPAAPVVVVCIDGCADEYISEAIAAGMAPNFDRLGREGYRGLCRGALPSFTNVNNAAIVCGAPPSVTGIPGNFFLDPDSDEEVMMNSDRFLRSETILAAASNAGRRVAMVTAKDKLRSLLSKGLEGIVFSAERAGEATVEANGVGHVEQLVGRPTPDVYSGDLSLFVLEAGAALLEGGHADFLYLTLSDYIQHKHAPGEPAAQEFYQGMDAALGRYLDAGAWVGITADHGMNGKTDVEGQHNIVYLQTLLDDKWGPGSRVILPITDPYVVHHGALGGYAVVHLDAPEKAPEIAAWILGQPGITEVYERSMAAQKLELPEDRLGELCVLAARDVVIGKTEQDHDLSLLQGRLRSHGGRYEEMVPLMLSMSPSSDQLRRRQGDPRSFDLYKYLCAGVQA